MFGKHLLKYGIKNTKNPVKNTTLNLLALQAPAKTFAFYPE